LNKSIKFVATGVVLLLIPMAGFIYLKMPQHRAQVTRELAEKGDGMAQYWTCLNYAVGIGVKKDMAEAAKWALKAEAQNYNCREKLAGKEYEDLLEEMARQDKLAGRKHVNRH
jgi:hypothetical protein